MTYQLNTKKYGLQFWVKKLQSCIHKKVGFLLCSSYTRPVAYDSGCIDLTSHSFKPALETSSATKPFGQRCLQLYNPDANESQTLMSPAIPYISIIPPPHQHHTPSTNNKLTISQKMKYLWGQKRLFGNSALPAS